MMTNYSEQNLIDPSLKIISNEKNGITTQNLIEKLRLALKPSGEDTLILSNRSDDKFSQKVRNLKSHKSLEKNRFVEFRDNKYFIREEGISYLNSIKSKDIIDFNQKEILFNFIPLKHLYFDERIVNLFEKEKCLFVYDLHQITSYGKKITNLNKYRNIGRKSIIAIDDFYKRFNSFIQEKNLELNLSQILSLYKKNKTIINNFIIENIETSIIDNKNDLSLSVKLIENFFENGFKSKSTYKHIFFERIIKNRTLDSVGKDLKVTRERIRQLEISIREKIDGSLIINNSLYQIDKLLRDIIFERGESFRNKLIESKVIKDDISLPLISGILNFLKFESGNKIRKINQKFFIFESKFYEKELIKNINKKFKKDATNNGIVNLHLLLKDINLKNFNITNDQLIDLIDKDLIDSSLNINNQFFLTHVYKNHKKSNNVLVGVIMSTMSVTKSIDVYELIDCIQRFRRINNYSPKAETLIEICKFLNFEVNGNTIINNNFNHNLNYLTGVRKKLVKMFLDNDRIMTYEEILEKHENYEININSVNVFIYENLFNNPRKGIFVLSGSNIDETVLDRLENSRKKLLKEIADSSEWSYNSDLNIVFSCNKISLLKGILYMPSNFADELRDGEYIIKNLNYIAKVKIFSSQLWFDVKSINFFKKFSQKKMKLVFDVINKTIEVY